jgi:hypothetical protein
MRGLSDGGAGRRDRGAAKKLHSSWESNCNRTSSKTDGDGQRLTDPVFGPIDLRSFGHGAGQFLPMATTRSWSCKGTDSSSGVIGGRAPRRGWLAALNSQRFFLGGEVKVYATLLHEGGYLCSERTMYRILSARQQVRER